MRRAALLMIGGCLLFQFVRASDVSPERTTREISASETPATDPLPRAEAKGYPKGIEHSFTLDRLAGLESKIQVLLERRAVDLSETVIRIYDANGKQFTERKFQFGAMPRDFVVKMQRRAERAEYFSRPDGESASLDPLTYSGAAYDPLHYSAFLFAQDGRGLNPCN